VTFDDRTDEDYASQQSDLELIVDKDTHQFVKGSSLEWVDDERGKGFVVENPNHKKYRGKFFKRKSWQQRLLKTHDAPSAEVNSEV
jgi:iron-sulfur cluster insertion protein